MVRYQTNKQKYIYIHFHRNNLAFSGCRFHLDKINRQIRTPRNIYAASCFEVFCFYDYFYTEQDIRKQKIKK